MCWLNKNKSKIDYNLKLGDIDEVKDTEKGSSCCNSRVCYCALLSVICFCLRTLLSPLDRGWGCLHFTTCFALNSCTSVTKSLPPLHYTVHAWRRICIFTYYFLLRAYACIYIFRQRGCMSRTSNVLFFFFSFSVFKYWLTFIWNQ